MSLMNTYARFPQNFPKGEGVYLYNQEGEKFLDLMSGIGVNALGYQHPKVLKAFQEALEKPTHVSNLYEIPEQTALAKTLCADSPFDQAFFCNSGTEANEGAIKLVRKYSEKISGKTKIISFTSSFHGRSMGSLTITGKESIKTGFKPLIGDTQILKWNSIEDLEKNVDESVAGIFLEPIQGEGGINLPNQKFLEKITQLCEQFDIALVVDEVQTGIGRTGEKFAFEHFNLQPDVICLAKGMGGGIPIGAILATEKVGNAFTPSTHGTTFGGNPLVCRVAQAVCREVLQKKFLGNINKNSSEIFTEIEKIQKKFPEMVLESRGKGLMIGIEINSVENRNTLIKTLLEKKFLVLPSGEKTLRLLPPLIIESKDLENFWGIFEEILETL